MTESSKPTSTKPSNEVNAEVEVSLVSEGDAYRAMHSMILVRSGGKETLFDLDESERPSSLVEAVLGVAGFVGRTATHAKVQTNDGDAGIPYVEICSFKVDASESAKVELAIHRAMTGELGGFAPVHAAATSFHQAPMVFEHVWAAAGRPTVTLRHRTFFDAASSSDFHLAGVQDVRLLSTLTRFSEVPKAPESDDDSA